MSFIDFAGSAVVIGLISDAPVVFSVLLFDRLKNEAYAPDTFSSSAAGQTA